jgi:hypothetical protein
MIRSRVPRLAHIRNNKMTEVSAFDKLIEVTKEAKRETLLNKRTSEQFMANAAADITPSFTVSIKTPQMTPARYASRGRPVGSKSMKPPTCANCSRQFRSQKDFDAHGVLERDICDRERKRKLELLLYTEEFLKDHPQDEASGKKRSTDRNTTRTTSNTSTTQTDKTTQAGVLLMHKESCTAPHHNDEKTQSTSMYREEGIAAVNEELKVAKKALEAIIIPAPVDEPMPDEKQKKRRRLHADIESIKKEIDEEHTRYTEFLAARKVLINNKFMQLGSLDWEQGISK